MKKSKAVTLMDRDKGASAEMMKASTELNTQRSRGD